MLELNSGRGLPVSSKLATGCRRFYSLVFYMLLPFIAMRLLWRATKFPEYAKRWRERLGFISIVPEKRGGILLHAVSVGEFVASQPLIKKLQERFPDLPLTITTTTPTGSARVMSAQGSKVSHVYMPYDLPDAVSRFLNEIEPKLVVIMETELWPNFLFQCYQRKIPVVIANGRLSERSLIGYRRVYPLAKDMLDHITLVAAQSDLDAKRYEQLGMPASQVRVTGNLKFDQEIPQSINEVAEQLRVSWDSTRPVWIAASTHEGEEEQVLSAFKNILLQVPRSLLLLVPRHPERFAKVIALTKKWGFNVATRSQNNATPESEVFVGDTMGELTTFYATADVAFVGGSLVAIGGHNLLEPAALGVPSLIGPHYFNMTALTHLMVEQGATRCVQDVEQLTAQVVSLLLNAATRHEMGEKGRQIVLQNRGAVLAHLNVVSDILAA